MLSLLHTVRNRLEGAGLWLAPLGLRLLLAYEFFHAGQQKLGAGLGEAPGWFANQNFPFPFGMLPPDINWVLVALGELTAGLALLFGLFTRLFAFVVLIITTVAIAAVHWPESWASLGQLWEGYSVSRVMDDGEFRGNFRIPLLFVAMLLPLLFSGGGRLSLDHLIVRLTGNQGSLEPVVDATAFALGALVFALATIWLIPSWGIALALIAIALFVRARMTRQAGNRSSD
ncbi:MAG: DoxX family protein [Xanthomonadales bacterium]|nr:DoxX family protein [Xanthomonadales bacterium]